jgi:hypothetical protein
MAKRTRTDETTNAAAKACRDLVLSSPAETAPGSAVPLRSNERETSSALRAWVRRYVAALAKADAEARLGDQVEETDDL